MTALTWVKAIIVIVTSHGKKNRKQPQILNFESLNLELWDY